MLLRPLKRVSVPDSTSAELVEPSAGLASAFIHKLNDMPKADDGAGVSGQYFSGLRILMCLYDDGRPFMGTFINDLHETNPELWNISVSEHDSPRQVLDAVDCSYLIRVLDAFLDVMTVTQMEDLNVLIREKVWIDRDLVKNDQTPTT